MLRRSLLALIAIAVGTASQAGRADEPFEARGVPTPTAVEARSAFQNVELQSAGDLLGKLVDQSGQPLLLADIQLETRQGQVVSMQTDRRGNFASQSLRGGEYRLVTGNTTTYLRLWAPGTAPPGTKDVAYIVVGDVVRGQHGMHFDANAMGPGHFDGFFMKVLSNPWIVGSATASAIAIPLLVDNSDAS